MFKAYVKKYVWLVKVRSCKFLDLPIGKEGRICWASFQRFVWCQVAHFAKLSFADPLLWIKMNPVKQSLWTLSEAGTKEGRWIASGPLTFLRRPCEGIQDDI